MKGKTEKNESQGNVRVMYQKRKKQRNVDRKPAPSSSTQLKGAHKPVSPRLGLLTISRTHEALRSCEDEKQRRKHLKYL